MSVFDAMLQSVHAAVWPVLGRSSEFTTPLLVRAILTLAVLLASPAPSSIFVRAGEPKSTESIGEGLGTPSEAIHERGGNPLWLVPLAALSATAARPIFAPSRRPPQVAALPPLPIEKSPETPPVRPPLLRLKLIGTVINGPLSIGIFLDEANNAVRIRIGESHDGWILRSVSAREVRLEKMHYVSTLAMYSAEGERSASRTAISARTAHFPR